MKGAPLGAKLWQTALGTIGRNKSGPSSATNFKEAHYICAGRMRSAMSHVLVSRLPRGRTMGDHMDVLAIMLAPCAV
jgi:hypothetical protein